MSANSQNELPSLVPERGGRQAILDRLSAEMQALRGRFGVMTLGIFGSVARGEEQAISDIDILVTFDGPATFDRFMGLKLYLEDTLGRSIDLVTPVTLRHETRPAVLRDLIDVA